MTLSMDDLRRTGVLQHATVFAVIITLLAILDWYTGQPYWVHWVFLGWGAGVMLHVMLALRR